MKSLVGILCLLFFACAHPQSPTVAIRGVTVVDVRDGSLHPERTVLVAGNRIAAVGPAGVVTVPDDAQIVEGAGGYLIPGLWDMHVHSVDPEVGSATRPAGEQPVVMRTEKVQPRAGSEGRD